MEHHGWDKYKEEGLAELKRIISSAYFSGWDELITLFRRYLELYTNDAAHQIKGTSLYEELSTQYAFDKASKQIKILRKRLRQFYRTKEGKASSFRIEFAYKKGDHRLMIRPVTSSNQVSSKDHTGSTDRVSYKENKHFEWSCRPLVLSILQSVSILVIILSGILLLSVVIIMINGGLRTHYWPSALFLFISVSIFLLAISIFRLPDKKFVAFTYDRFLKLSGKNTLSIASYIGACPICKGEVQLKYSLLGWNGYRAKCSNNPDDHIFTFDHTTLSGRSI